MRRLWILGLPFLVALSAALCDQLAAPLQAAAYDDDDYYRDRDVDDDDDALGSEVTVRYFRDELAPYGDWVRVPTYGWAWRPYNVGADWQPYTVGRWIDTEYGWTWVSDEPWGRSPYHYGRWYWDRRYGGWVWVPGRRWAPAWVDWREGARYWGWAPLPPTAAWQPEAGGIPTRTVIIEPRHYCFVEKRYIAEPNIHRYIAPPAQNVTIIHNTTNITNYTIVNHRVANHSIREATVEKAIGHQVPRYPVAEVESAAPRAFHEPDGHAPARRAEQNEPRRGFEARSAAPPAAVEGRGHEQVDHDRVDAAERERERQDAESRERERARLDHEREDRDRKAAERAQDAERQREAARTREAARQADAERQREALRRHELEVREHEAKQRLEVERSREAAHQQAIRRQEAERARTERRAEDESARRQQAEVERHRASHTSPHPQPSQQQQTDPRDGHAPPPRQPY